MNGALRVATSVILILSFSMMGLAQSNSVSVETFVAHLPEGAITLDLLLSRGMSSSSSYEIAVAPLKQQNADELDSRAVLSTRLEIEGSWIDDQNESTTSVSPSATSATNFKLSLNKMFSSGTSISLGLLHGDGEIEFTTFAPSIFKQSEAKLMLVQDLWRDFAGRAIRWQLQAGDLKSQSVRLSVDENVLDWMKNFTSLFYAAWLAQSQVRAAEQSMIRKKRLLSITQLQVNRGTAELPDLYQVKRAYKNSVLAFEDSQQEIKKIWRQLIIALKIHQQDMGWLQIDPMQIPIRLDQPVDGAIASCKKSPGGEAFVEQFDLIKLKQKEAEAAQLLLKSARDAMHPEVKLAMGLTTNGVDTTDRGKTISEALSNDNPEWLVSLQMKMSFDHSAEKAQVQRLSTQQQIASTGLDLARSDFILNWLDQCAMLQHWQSKLSEYGKILSDQNKRVVQEEERFRLGRVPLLNVITAADEATETEMALNRSKKEVRLAAWGVHRLNGFLKNYMNRLRQQSMAAENQ